MRTALAARFNGIDGLIPSLEFRPANNRAGGLAKLLFWSLACLILVSLLSMATLVSLRQAGWWRNHTHEAIEHIDTLELLLAKSAAWYGTYQVTQRTSDLFQSDKQIYAAQRSLLEFQQLTRDNSYQQQRISILDGLIASWLQQRSILINTSRPFMNAFPLLTEMKAHEQALLSSRSERMKTIGIANFCLNSFLLLFALASLSFCWTTWNQENRWNLTVLDRLHSTEARFQAFMDHSPLLAFIKNRESRIIYSNQPWKRFTDVALDTTSGEELPAQLGEQLRSRDQEVFESNGTQEFVQKVTGANGKTYELLVVMFPFRLDNESTLLGGLALDVTEERRAQRALGESEERLRLAMQAASMQVWEFDIKKGEIYSDFTNFGLTGPSAPRRLSLSEALQLVHPECRASMEESLRKAVLEESSCEMLYQTVSGRWIASSAAIQFDEFRKPVRLAGFIQDQTEKIVAEKKLAELRSLHDSILRCTHTALISVDENRIVTSWNPAAERLLGYTAEEVIGRATPDLWYDPVDAARENRARESDSQFDRNPLLAQALVGGEETRECTFTRKDGSKVPVRLTVTPILNEDRWLMGFLNHATDISELRRASHQVQELNQALQDTMSGWAKIDLDGRYVRVNKAYAETAGYSAKEMIGLSWHTTIYPEDLPAVLEANRAMMTTGRGAARARGLRRSGSIFHLEVFLAPAHDHVGTRVGSYCFMRDVTARMEAEVKLEASERRYREFFELNPLPCWIYDFKTLKFGAVNEAAVRHYGYTREQFLAMSVYDIRLPEDADTIEGELTRASLTSPSMTGPWRNTLSDGNVIEVELAARDLSDTERLVVVRDVTEQRRAEALLKSEATLQEAQQIARLGSWELDTRSGAVTWSPETYRIFGLEALAEKLRFEEFMHMVHPEDREQVGSAIANSVHRKQVYDLEFRILRQDGELRHVHGRGQYSNGSRQCLAGTMLDITEQKQFQNALQQSLEEKEVLLKEIHHRVKNNLQVISCLLNMQAGALKEDTACTALRESERRVMAMALIHERLYGHNRMDRINFCDYAQTLVGDLLASYSQNGLEVESHYSLAPVDLDIEQAIPCGLILNELVTNALKYAYSNGKPGDLFISFQPVGDQKVSLSISDNGPGLPQDFDWKKAKSLGLTIVRLLTKQLGGNLHIESSGSGALFTVIFPKAS